MLGLYKHYKGGLYAALTIVTNSTTGDRMVLYYSLSDGALHVRNINEFHELVKWPDGKKMPRFMAIGD